MKTSPPFRSPLLVAGYFLAWTLLGLFYFTREVSRRLYWDEPFDWRNTLTIWLVGEYIWAIVALVVFWFGTRWPLERPVLRRRIALHLMLSIVVAAAQLALEAAAYLSLGTTLSARVSSSFWHAWPALLVAGFHGNVTVYWVILGVHTGYRYYRKLQYREAQALRLELHAAELRGQLVRAQMSALKMQLQPHFLFNTLNAIMVLVRQKRVLLAEEMLGRLADLLRCVLEEGEAQEVPLHRELEYVRLYLAIEQVRFEDRMRVTMAIDPAALDAAVPHMALQPIVENAVRHGIARTSRAGTIHISASAADTTIEIRVRDDGPGINGADGREGWGIGLANTRSRLAQLYGTAASLTIRDGAPGAIVTMVLPRRDAPETSMRDMTHAAHVADR